jgi:hypothetical protein
LLVGQRSDEERRRLRVTRRGSLPEAGHSAAVERLRASPCAVRLLAIGLSPTTQLRRARPLDFGHQPRCVWKLGVGVEHVARGAERTIHLVLILGGGCIARSLELRLDGRRNSWVDRQCRRH